MMKRFHSLDALRGFAALGVVVWHWQHFFFVGAQPAVAFEQSTQPLYGVLFLFYELGWLGVDLFFCLSGFIFFWLYSERIARGMGAFEFTLLRVARLYPLHALTLCVVGGLQLWHVSATGTAFVYQANDWTHFGLNALMMNGWGLAPGFSFNGPAWSLSIEVLMYAAFYLLCRFVPLSPTLLALVVAVSVLGIANHDIARGASGFFAGGLTFYAYQWAKGLPRQAAVEAGLRVAMIVAWSLTIVAVRFGLSAGYFVPFAPRWMIQHFPTVVLFPLTILCLVVAETRRGPIGARLAFLGDASYSIYLWHFPLQIVFAMLLPRAAFLSPITFTAFFAVLMGFSMVSYRLFESPARRLLLARLTARPHAGPPRTKSPVGAADAAARPDTP